jgi:WD40 repeat protein
VTTDLTPPRTQSEHPGWADCPYKGLQPYTEEDGAYYFGRDIDRDLVIANLMASRLTVLYGPSGVGKSSLLQAGVARRLRSMPEETFSYLAAGHVVVVYYATWRGEPLAGLGDALRVAIDRTLGSAVGPLPAGPLSVDLLREVSTTYDADVYLLLDQFEEQSLYLTSETAQQFAAELGRIVEEPGLRTSVLIGVREDALAKLDRLEEHVPGLFGNNLRLNHLSMSAARDAIEQPLARYNETAPGDARVSVEPGLVEVLLTQLRTGHVSVTDGGQGGHDHEKASIETPFLQLVMTRLWMEERAKGSSVLRESTLHELGDAERIVRTHLDDVMDHLSPAQRRMAALVFRHLVTPSGMKVAHTAEDLAEYASSVSPRELTDVLERLASGRERILRPVEPPMDRPEAPRYEIFHDVLAPAVLDWQRRYIAEQERLASEQALVARQQEAEREHRATRRRLRRSRLVSAALVLLLVAAVTNGVRARRNKDEANRKTGEALALSSLAGSQQRLASSPTEWLQKAMKAYRNGRSTAAEALVREAFDADRERLNVKADSGILNSGNFSPNGQLFAAGGADGKAKVFDVRTGKGLHTLTPTGTPTELLTVSFSPDGTMLATTSVAPTTKTSTASTASTTSTTATPATSANPQARVYDVKSGKLLLTVAEYKDGVSASWGTVDGDQVLLTGGRSTPAQTWLPRKGRLLARYGKTAAYSFAAAFSRDSKGQDSKNVVTASGTTLSVWDTRTGRLLKHSKPLGEAVSLPTFVGTGSDRVAVWVLHKVDIAGETEAVWSPYFWRWRTSSTATSTGDVARVPTPITVSADGALAAVISDKEVFVYNANEELVAQLPAQADLLTSVDFSPDNQWLITAGIGGHARVWLIRSSASGPIATLQGHLGGISEAHFAHKHPPLGDPSMVVTAGEDGTARLWQLPSRTVLVKSARWIQGASLSPDGQKVVSISDLGTLRVSNLAGEIEKRQFATEFDGTVYLGVQWLPNGRQAVVSFLSGLAPMVWEPGSDKRPYSLEPNDQSTNGLAVNAGGDRTAMGDDKNQVVVWNTKSGRIVTKLAGGDTGHKMLGVSFIPGSSLVGGASTDGKVRLWDLAKHGAAPVRTLGRVGDSPLTRVDVSADGAGLVTTAVNHQLKIYRVRDGALLTTIQGPSNVLGDVSFSKDGRMLAAAADDGSVYVWHWRTGRQLAVLHRHGDAVNSVEFTPDGHRLVTASDDGTVAIFDCTTCEDIDSLWSAAQARQSARARHSIVPLHK